MSANRPRLGLFLGVLAARFWAWVPAEAAEAGRDAALPSYRVTHWTAENGLPQNQVKALVQTHDGYLWVGTLNGLARFDGVSFTVFDHNNTPEMLNDAINDLAEDAQDHSLWVATGNGLLRYRNHHFERFGAERGFAEVGIVAPSREGGVWCELGPGKLGRLRRGQTEFFKLEPRAEGNACRCLAEKAPSAVLALVDNDLYEFNVSKQQARLVASPAPERGACRSFVCDEANTLWLLTVYGIWRGDPSNWTRVLTVSDALHGPWPASAKHTSDGQAWVIMSHLSGKQTLTRLMGNDLVAFAAPDFPPDASVTRLIEDREGSIWLGSHSGLFRLRPKPLEVYSCADGLSSDDVQAVALGCDGTVWVGTSLGLSGIGPNGPNQITNLPPRHANDPIWYWGPVNVFLPDSRGWLWFDVTGHPVRLRDGRWVDAGPPPALDIRLGGLSALFEDRQHRIWMGTGDAVLCNDRDRWTYYPTTNNPPHTSVRVIHQDRHGDIWFGLYGGGLNRLRDGQITVFQTQRGELNNRAWSIHEDAEGIFWLGSQEGLNRFVPPELIDPANDPPHAGRLSEMADRELRITNAADRFFTFTMQHGLRENVINNIQEDQFGYLWLSGLKGIYRVSRQELNQVAWGQRTQVQVLALGEADGMLSSECNGGDNQPAGCKDRQGRIWFPTTKGVVAIDPKTIHRNDVPPPVVIEKVIADDEPVYGDGAPVGSAVESRIANRKSQSLSPPSLRLAAGRARVLEIHYTANSFAAPERMRFKYLLEGYDQDWHWDDANRRVAFYTSLQPGTYTFRVTACNNHGVWNRSPEAFAFSLAPHFWQTWPFYLVSGVSVLAGGLGLHRQRLRGMHRLQLAERQRALEQQRTRIARDLHDDLGASLTGIALQLEAARRHGHAEGDQLAALAMETRSLAHDLRELAWTTNPRCDNTVSLAAFLGELAERFCQAAGLKCQLDLPIGADSHPVPARVRHELLVVSKESLANVAKHAGARGVSVSLALTKGEARLVIQDDGHGFDSDRVTGGNGLRNLRERILQLGGSFTIRSRPGWGTTVTANLPLHNHTNS